MIDYLKMLDRQIGEKEKLHSDFRKQVNTSCFFWYKYVQGQSRIRKLEASVVILTFMILTQSVVFIAYLAR